MELSLSKRFKRIGQSLLPKSILNPVLEYRNTPSLIRNRRMWGIRRALMPYIHIPMWAVSHEGARFFLGADPIDDVILQHVLRDEVELYFPAEINEVVDEDLLVLEIGAHHGYVAVEWLRRLPRAKLIAVEPNPTAVEYLRKNLAANNLLGRAEVVAAGIGSHDGTAFLEFSKDGSWGDTTTSTSTSTSNGVEVQTLTLSSILKGRQPSIVKCNAEGAEFELITQLSSLGLHPKVIILMAHAEYGSVEGLVTILQRTGYSIKDAKSGDPDYPHLHCFFDRFSDNSASVPTT